MTVGNKLQDYFFKYNFHSMRALRAVVHHSLTKNASIVSPQHCLDAKVKCCRLGEAKRALQDKGIGY